MRLPIARLPHTHVKKRMPTEADIAAIPLARAGEYELNEREVYNLRKFLYGINKDGIRRYRTMKDGPILMVWRIQ